MGADGHLDWNRALASALEWWHDAGVDTLVDDAPRDWLAPPAALPPALSSPAALSPSAVRPPVAAMPGDLAGFLAWRAGPDAPEAAWRGPLAPAAGPAGAPLMILVDCPDRDDGVALLSDETPAGRLFDRMLAAIGVARDAVHLAAVHWRRPPPGRSPREIEERLGELARRHVALVAPARLLLMGDAASRAILATNVVEARDGARVVNHDGRQTRVVASFHPRLLIDRPATKREAWRDLQALMAADGPEEG